MPPGYPSREAPPSSSDPQRVPPPWPPRPQQAQQAQQDVAPRTPPPWPPQASEPAPRTPPPWPPQPQPQPQTRDAAPLLPPFQPPPLPDAPPYVSSPGLSSPGVNSGHARAVGQSAAARPSIGAPSPGAFTPPHPISAPGYVPSTTPPQGPVDYRRPPSQPIHRDGRPPAAGSRPPVRMPLTRALRTDPTLYEWDRLSPEKKEAVLAAIRNTPPGGRSWALSKTVLVVATLVLLLLLVVAGAAFVLLR